MRRVNPRPSAQQYPGLFPEKYDLLLCPAAIVPPFDVDMRYVEEVNGERFVITSSGSALPSPPPYAVARRCPCRQVLPLPACQWVCRLSDRPAPKARVLATAALLSKTR
ncbi:MAG: hypothetical protein R3F53_06930 [Gammaproteobacteria bacterium]